MKLKQIFTNMKLMFQLIWKNNKSYVVFSFLQVISSSITPFINIVAFAFLVDSVVNSRGIRAIITIVAAMVILDFVFMNLQTLSDNFVKLNAKKLMMPMSAGFSYKSAEMDYQYTENREVLEQMGKAAYVLLNTDNLELYLGAVNKSIIYFIQMIITTFIISSLNPLIIILVLCVSIINLIVNLKTQGKNYDIQKEIMPFERKWKYITDIAENMMYGKEVRLYDLSHFVFSKGKENREQYKQKFDKMARNTRRSGVIGFILTGIQEASILIWLVISVLAGSTSIASFALLFNTSRQFAQSFGQLSGEIVNLYANDNFINEFFKFLNYKSMMRSTEKKNTEINRKTPGTLKFKNVSFRYPNSDSYVLRNVSLTIDPGERLSIVGENGAGKTTFVKLLMRLYDVTEGEILYDGVNIKDYNYDDYMDVFSTLFQDYKVFAISIYENVTFHENPQDKDKIDDIFKEYGIFDKVQSLPKKGETIMSKEFEAEGMELSGGQQQRLAICRAVYKNAPFYILDEPTANLSPVAEHDIYLQFDKMVGGKSAIYISHRLSSSKFCDKICVFDKGQIAEYGSHNELMKNDGIYAKMFRLQSQYYVEKV